MKKDKETLVIDLFGLEEAPFTKYPRPELSPEEAVFYLVYVLDAEVRNGGLYGYFGNLIPGDYLVGDLNAALEAVGAKRTASLMREASQAIFGVPAIPSDLAMLETLVDNVTDEQLESLSVLDDRFYEEELPPLLYDYAQANQTAIRGAPEFFSAVDKPSLTDRFKGFFGR